MLTLLATTCESYWGPQLFCLAQALRDLGSETQLVTQTEIANLRAPKSCDLLFCLGSRESLQPVLSMISARKRVVYLIESIPTLTESDPFTVTKLTTHAAYLKAFDHIFVHTPRSVPTLQSLELKNVKSVIWPHFPTFFHPVAGVAQDLDLWFVGNVSPHREWIIDRINTRFRAFTAIGIFHGQTSKVYARARIVLNIHFTPLLNLECRVVEALGCGSFLLTEKLDPPDVFVDGQHLATFDESNVCDRVEYFLAHPEDRSKIASAGHAAVKEYTVEGLAQRILAAVA